MSTATVYLPLERSRYFRDDDGVLSTSKYHDEIVQLVLDWTDQLSGDTISSVAYTDNGVTTSGTSNTTTTTTCTVTGTGWLKIVVTTAASRTLERHVRYYDREGNWREDYEG